MTLAPVNPAIWYAADGYDTSRPNLMGRQAAGEAFLKAYARDPAVDVLHALAGGEEPFARFQEQVAALAGRSVRTRWIPRLSDPALADRAVVYHPSPGLERIAWHRQTLGADRRFALCGVFHTTASAAGLDAIGGLLTAPLRPWDAVICPSRAVRGMVDRVLTDWAAHLADRLGVSGWAPRGPVLPVIPLGVDCAAFAPGPAADAARRAWRERLGLDAETVCVLFMGRLSFHAKAHPLPMYAGLEQAARATGKQVALVQAGWFATPEIESQIRQAATAFAPSVRHHFVDGRDPAVRREIWFAADLFTALSDNIQETFGLVPIEAKAAGLPLVVSDWNGYRDTVQPDVDGYAIPTVMPGEGCGLRLARAHGDERISYDSYIGAISQTTAVDVALAAAAYRALLDDPARRRAMGEAGRADARARFDWPVVLDRYRALWAWQRALRDGVAPPEIDRDLGLDAPRPPAPAAGSLPLHPLRGDPYRLFAGYPTAAITPAMELVIGPSLQRDAESVTATIDRLRAWTMLNIRAAFPDDGAGLRRVAISLALMAHETGAGSEGGRGPRVRVGQVMAAVPDLPDDAVARALGWLGKTGLIRLLAN